MLSTDASILKPNSAAAQRMAEYGALAEQLDIIVCTVGARDEVLIANNVRAIPTNSRSKFWYVRDMLAVAKHSISSGIDVVTSQDPFETGLGGWWISRRLKAKLQLQVHTDFLSPYFARESLKNRIRVWIAKWLLPKADSVRVVS
ncbi:MAG: glycosyltransferase [Patescibacteria group bacterium]|nr:glycosyltransferase [Patescibacteria group bacterium]